MQTRHLAGAYLELPYADPGALDEALPSLDELLSTFDTVRASLPGPPPAHRGELASVGAPAGGLSADGTPKEPVGRQRRKKSCVARR